MVSLLNGFSQMGQSVAGFAHDAGLAEQKSELEKQQLVLANQLQEGSQTRLAHVQGDESRQTAVTSADAQGSAARTTAQFENTLPLTAAQKEDNKIKHQEADTHRMDAMKPVSGGFTGAFMVPDSSSPYGWKPVTASGSPEPIKIDKDSNNLSSQTGLSQTAIGIMTGQTKGLRLNAAQSKAAQEEITRWGVAQGINTSTMLPQVEGAFKVITQNVTRNNQAQILEDEINGSVETVSKVLDDTALSNVNVANVAARWAGKEVNDPASVQVADQLNRLREELAGYNAIASGHLNDNGAPAISPEDRHAAESTILTGITSGGLKALNDSVKNSAEKNKVVLQKAINKANTDFYNLFGAKYHAPDDTTKVPPADASTTAAPPATEKTPQLPTGVPSGAQYSPSRKQWRDSIGKIYDENGNEVK